MSAAVLRRPAPWPRVARAEAAALLHSRAVPLTLLGVVLLASRPVSGGQPEWPYDQLRAVVPLMFFFPLLHWRGRAGRGSLDQAVPIGAWGHELVRVGCGALAAAFTLALAAAVHTWSLRPAFGAAGGYPASYPVVLTLTGVAYSLFGSAVMLRASRPGRVLLGTFAIGTAVMLLTGVGLERYGKLTEIAEDGSRTVTYTTSLMLAPALLWLAGGVAAVLLSVWLGRREPAAAARRLRSRASTPLARPARARVDARSLRTPRSPATARMVAARQFAGMAPRMAWPLAMAAALGVWSAVWEMRSGPTHSSFLAGSGPFIFLWIVAFFWPLLVWVEERAGRDWDAARPLDALTRRLLQAGAGLAWLQGAVHLVLIGCIGGAAAVGTVGSSRDVPGWAWPGLPLCAAALYFLGSLPALLSRRPAGWSIIGILLLAQALTLSVILLRTGIQTTPVLAPSRVFAPVASNAGGEWSLAAALLWIPIFAAMTVAAVHRRVRLDRQGLFAGQHHRIRNYGR
ncbi:MAG: hypothetical protein KY467_02960 [Gemmatimonadetes bacterium]|nr:hypothetical protein [Gemmatimonadota bacterium]